MIAADRQELEVKLKQRALEIREKEVGLFSDNFAVIATQAAFLAGVGFDGLFMLPENIYNKTPSQFHEILFYTSCTLAIGLNILTAVVASYLQIKGPSLAIRGPDGSMSRAIHGMFEERRWLLRFFWAGLLAILIAAIFLGHMKFDSITAWSMTVVIVIFLGIIAIYMRFVVRPKFAFPKGHRRRDTGFLVDGYNPESGHYSSTGIPGSTRNARTASHTGGRPRPQDRNMPTASATYSTEFDQGDDQFVELPVQVRINETGWKEEKNTGKKVVLYFVETSVSGIAFKTIKRYSEFYELTNVLRKRHKNEFAISALKTLPSKGNFLQGDQLQPAFIDNRRAGLEGFLNRIMDVESLKKDAETCNFLNLPTNWYKN